MKIKLFWFAKSIYHCECRFHKGRQIVTMFQFFPFSLCSSCFPSLVLKCLCLSCMSLIVCLWPWRSPLHFTRSTLLLLTERTNSPVPHHFISLHCIWCLVLQKPSLDRSVDMCGTSSHPSAPGVTLPSCPLRLHWVTHCLTASHSSPQSSRSKWCYNKLTSTWSPESVFCLLIQTVAR